MEHEKHLDTEHHEDAHRESVSRRTILVLAGTAIAAAAIPSALFLAEPETASGRAAGFMRLLADPESAAHLGEVWFEKSAPGATLAVYEARLSRTLQSHGWQVDTDEAETHRILARAVREDYAANRMTAIDEWHLSETEANLCALAALLARRDPAHGEEEAHG